MGNNDGNLFGATEYIAIVVFAVVILALLVSTFNCG